MRATKLRTMRNLLAESTIAVAIAIAAPALIPSPAAAATATFYAGPNGTGGACTQTSPCSLQSALSAANADGDTVYLASGQYGSASSPTNYTITHAITIAGVPGTNSRGLPNRPELVSSSGPILTVDSPTGTVTLQDLTLDNLTSGNALVLQSPTNVDRVSAQSNDTACLVEADAVVRDSVCATPSGYAAIDVEENTAAMTVTLRNDTIVQNGYDYGLYAQSLYGSLTVNVSNTIIFSRNISLSAFASEPSASTSINIDHSNYNGSPSALLIGNGSYGATALNAGAGNQTHATPVFRDLGSGDYQEAAGSPTIDAGAPSVDNGTLGLDGNPRTYGSAPDIGAYEYVPAPTPTTGDAQPSLTGATLSGTVNPNGIETHYWVDYWPQTTGGAQTQETAPIDAGSGTAAIPASVQITGLQPNTTYDYEFVAASGGGVVTDTSGMRSFTTTTAPPVASTGTASNIDETTATVAGTVTANGLAGTYEVQYGTSPTSLTGTSSAGSVGVGTAPQTVSAALTGLQPATTYYYRLVARNADGPSVNTAVQHLTTLTPPEISAAAVNALTATSARLSATIDPQGRDTSYRFEYRAAGSTGAYSTAAGSVVHAGAPQTVSAVLTGLAPATEYQWQIVATHGSAGAVTVSLTGAPFQTSVAAPPPASAPPALTSTAPPMTSTTPPTASTPTPMLGSQSGSPTSMPSPSSVSDHARPSITKLRLVSLAERSPRLTIEYRDSEAGRTTFVLLRVLPGVRHGRSCVAPPRHAGGHSRRCTRLVKVRGPFSRADLAGENRFSLRVGGLATGSYVLVVTPRSSTGAAGPAHSVRFRVPATARRAARRRHR